MRRFVKGMGAVALQRGGGVGERTAVYQVLKF